MDQKQINEAEWQNPDNWSGCRVGVYFSKKDTRTWVPKPKPWAGWTLNLGQPAGARWLSVILIGIPLLIIILAIVLIQVT